MSALSEDVSLESLSPARPGLTYNINPVRAEHGTGAVTGTSSHPPSESMALYARQRKLGEHFLQQSYAAYELKSLRFCNSPHLRQSYVNPSTRSWQLCARFQGCNLPPLHPEPYHFPIFVVSLVSFVLITDSAFVMAWAPLKISPTLFLMSDNCFLKGPFLCNSLGS